MMSESAAGPTADDKKQREELKVTLEPLTKLRRGPEDEVVKVVVSLRLADSPCAPASETSGPGAWSAS
jgi:hypothetical protein